jgi:hypothetical protein
MPRVWLWMILAAALLQGCGVNVAPEEKLVFHYSEGIQSLHQPTYQDFFLACHPDEPTRDLAARIANYEAIRKKGSITFSPDGVEIIKLGALGRGAYFRVREIRKEGESLEFKTLLRPDYLSINFTEFPPNAILYIMGEPLGSVIKLGTGKTPGPERSVLDSVDLKWTWTRQAGNAASEWCLRSVAPIPESAIFRKLQFREALPPESSSP